MRSAGIFILLYKNHTPTISIMTAKNKATLLWIINRVENVCHSLSLSPAPIAYVRNLVEAPAKDPFTNPNTITIPPTTL